MGERLRTVGAHTGSSSFANHNVVGLARASDGQIIRQYRYSPYGKLEAAEGLTMDASGDCSLNPLTSFDSLETFHTFQGLWYDPYTSDPPIDPDGANNVRARIYRPPLARFLQQDPNGQALAIANALAMNGQTRAVFASLSASTQYADGLNLYQFVGSNPNTATDPSGQLIGYQRFAADVVGSAVAAYAFSLDAGVYSLLEEGSASGDFDRVLDSVPYSIGGAFVGGAVAFASRWSPIGNILGGSMAGGLSTFGLGKGFTSGALIGGGVSTAFEVAFKALGKWRTGAVVGGGAVGGGTGWTAILRVLRGRGILASARQKAIIPTGTAASKVAGLWAAAIAPRSGKVYVSVMHAEAIRLAQEGAVTKAGIRSGWVNLNGAGEVISTTWEKTW